MTAVSERMQILAMIESGKITVDQGLDLLKALEDQAELDAGQEREESDPTKEEQRALPPTQGELTGFETNGIVQPSLPEAVLATIPDDLPSMTEIDGSMTPPGLTARQQQEAVPHPVVTEEPESTIDSIVDPSMAYFRRWWMILMWVGLGITFLGALLMFWALQASGIGFWFACAWFPFLLGVLVLALAWSSRTMRWLHVRITQKPGEKPQHISISLPLPLRATAWFVRTFGRFIPDMPGSEGLEQVFLALEHTTPDQPFYINVDEGEDGEKVQVFIG